MQNHETREKGGFNFGSWITTTLGMQSVQTPLAWLTLLIVYENGIRVQTLDSLRLISRALVRTSVDRKQDLEEYDSRYLLRDSTRRIGGRDWWATGMHLALHVPAGLIHHAAHPLSILAICISSLPFSRPTPLYSWVSPHIMYEHEIRPQ